MKTPQTKRFSRFFYTLNGLGLSCKAPFPNDLDQTMTVSRRLTPPDPKVKTTPLGPCQIQA